MYNIGNSTPTPLLELITALERHLGRTAEKVMAPMQMGDVPATWADVSDLTRDTGFSPGTPIDVGVGKFVEWYKTFYGV